MLGLESRWGVVGLSASASLAAWVEFVLLRRSLNARIGDTGLSLAFLTKVWFAAFVGAAVAWGLKFFFGGLHPIPVAAIVLGSYGLTYFGVTYVLGVAESEGVINRGLRMLRLKR
jgi:putative peptidoglycan lipid II flippase